jgi:hypothetical protein
LEGLITKTTTGSTISTDETLALDILPLFNDLEDFMAVPPIMAQTLLRPTPVTIVKNRER